MLLLALAEHVVVAGGDAVPFLERIQQEYPDDFWSNSTLGIRLTETSDEAPIRYFQAAVAVRPDDCFARTNLGSALGASGRTEEAMVQLQKAVLLEPTNGPAHMTLSMCFKSQGRMAEALDAFRTAIRLDPGEDNTAQRRLVVEWLIDLDRLDEAIAEAREALRVDPRSFDVHLRLGFALQSSGRFEEALETLRGAIAIDSRSEAHELLGLVLAELERGDEAIASLREAVRLGPGRVVPRRELVKALIARGLFADARTEARRFLESRPAGDPGRPEARAFLDFCELVEELEASLPAIADGTRAPATTDECLALAHLFRARRQPATAARYFADAFELGAPPAWRGDWRTYDAALCAAQAGAAGEAQDSFADEERAGWRSLALAWLRQDLTAFEAMLADGAPGSGREVRWNLMQLRREPDLAGIRDAASLERLPADERAQWQALWSGAASLESRARSEH